MATGVVGQLGGGRAANSRTVSQLQPIATPVRPALLNVPAWPAPIATRYSFVDILSRTVCITPDFFPLPQIFLAPSVRYVPLCPRTVAQK